MTKVQSLIPYVDFVFRFFIPTGYALASEGFRCEDIGMKATEELESCKAAMSTIQKIIPDIGKWDDIVKDSGSFHNQPKGCSVADNKIYLNTGDTDSMSAGSRQVCSGKLSDKLHPIKIKNAS